MFGFNEEINFDVIDSIKNKYLEIDKKLYEQNKSTKQYIFKCYRSKRIVTSFGNIKIKRRIYLNPENKKYVYLLDQHLNFKKYTQYDNLFLNKLANLHLQNQMSYNKLSSYLKTDNIYYSASQLNRLVLQYCDYNNKYDSLIINPQNYKYLYINIDDTFISTKHNKKKTKNCYRVICCHQGKDENNSLINKTLITIPINKKDHQQFIEFIKDKLINIYGDLNQFKLIILSDGASNFKYMSLKLNAKLVLDKFHVFRNIR